MKKPFTFAIILSALLSLSLMFITTASANSALVAGPCYRETCDGTFAHLTTNGGTVVLDESQSLIVDTGPAKGLNVGSLRLYHDLGSKAMHGTVHENSAGMAAILTFTVTITQTDMAAGTDTVQVGSQATCGNPSSGTGFCDTLQIGTDGTLADCFVVSLVWSQNGVEQTAIASINGDPPYCVTG